MALIEALTINVAAKLAKVVVKLWLKDEGLVGGAEGVIETIKKYFEDWRVARSAEGLIRNLEDDVATRLERFIRIEFPNLADSEREAAALAVAAALGKLELGPAIMRADLDATLLERAVREADPDAFRLLGQDTRSLAERLRRECCNYIVTLAPKLPQFDADATKELLLRSTSILRELQSVLDEVVAVRRQASETRDQAAAEFEHEYRFALARALDRVELFGVRITGAATREYGLTRTYVPLSAVPEGAAQPCRVDDALTGAIRILVRGEAGFGKTIFMQWLGVQAARRGFVGALETWNERVPFYLRLREFRDSSRPFPTPGQFLSGPLANLLDLMPKGWANRAMSEFALVLVDGVDEVPAQRRKQLFDWLRGLQDQYPKTVFVVSSRPAALDADEEPLGLRLSGAGYKSLTLEPMTPDDSEALVIKWHAEVATGLADPAVLAQLAENERSLRRAVRERPAIRSLGANPLLCTMMCALNWDQKANLPNDRMELYRVALELLLERREKDREIGATYIADLDRSSKETILDHIAYWMLRNGVSQADRNEAENRISELLPRLAQLPKKPHLIMQELVERSGILRQPQHGVVDFVHRTFLEYMGARAALGQGDRDALIDRAGEESWRDVIVFAAGHAQGKARDDLIAKLLRPGWLRSPRSIDAEITSVCCLETVGGNLDPQLLVQLHSKAKGLFPPTDLATARILSPAATNNPEFLKGHTNRPVETVAACIRCASIVGTPHMVDVIAGYAAVPGDIIDQEITRAYQIFDNPEYEDKVLKVRDELFGLKLSSLDPEGAECFKLLLRYKRPRHAPQMLRGTLEAFKSGGRLSLTDFVGPGIDEDYDDIVPSNKLKGPLATGMRTRTSEVERISRLRSLKSLRLASVDPDAIERIASLGLRDLHFAVDEFADLGPIADMQGLESLFLRGNGIVRLESLRRLPKLEEISIESAKFYDQIDFIGPNSTLTRLSLSNIPVTDLAPVLLARGLKYLSITSVPFTDYRQLAELDGLEELELNNIIPSQEFSWSYPKSLKKITLRSPTPLLTSDIQNLANIEEIVVYNPPEGNLSWIPSSIKKLEIWRNNYALDIHDISRLTKLTKFDSSECAVVGAAALTELPALAEVIFYDSSGDFAPIIPVLEAKGVKVKNWQGPFRSRASPFGTALSRILHPARPNPS
jgi:hypothetical protein